MKRFATPLLVFVLGTGQAAALPYSNDGLWRHVFSKSDFKRPDIAALVEKYRKTRPPDKAMAARLAGHGAAVVPYMMRLMGGRRVHFFFLDPKGGLFGHFLDHPYMGHMDLVVSNITDPGAIPLLKRIMNETYIGGSARRALFKMKASFARDEVVAEMRADNEQSMTAIRLSDYAEMMRGWNKDDISDVLIDVFDKEYFQPYLTMEMKTHVSMSGPDGVPVQWVLLTRLLLDANTMKANRYLDAQRERLQGRIANLRKEVEAPDAYVRHTESEIERLKWEMEQLAAVLSAYPKQEQSEKVSPARAR